MAILVYTSRRDWVLETDAAIFARQHDPDAAQLDVDDALERLEGQGLIVASGKPTQLRITLRGQAFLQALHEGRHDRAALGRARGLFGGEIRPNPAQGSFSWAGDPRQLTMSFDAPKAKASPEASPEARAAFGAASAAELRRSKPKPEAVRGRRPKAESKTKHPWGRIELDGAGNLTPKGIRAWSERAAPGVAAPMESTGPELPWPPEPSYHAIRDAWRSWVEYGFGHDSDKPRWQRFWKDYREIWTDADGDPKLYHGHELTHERAMRESWIRLAGAERDDEPTWHGRTSGGLPLRDDDAYARLREAVRAHRISSWGGPDEIRATERELDAAWLALLNRWLDRPWSYPRQNPEAGSSKTTRERGAAKQRIAGYRSEIRSQRTEQKRARADRKAELDQARGQTKRIRAKVTTASAGRRARIRQRAWDRIDRARARIEEMRRYWAEERGKAPPPGTRKRTAGEQTEEVEREIRAIDPMLVPLWRANRALFKGTPHERFERFLEWADEQGEADVWAAIEKTLPTDAALARDYEAWIESQDDPAYLAWKAAQSAA